MRQLSLLIGLIAVLVPMQVAGAGERPPTPVRITEVSEQPVQPTTRLVGSLQAVERVALAAEEAGRLLAVLVDSGDRVAAGDAIARIDPQRLDAAIAEAQARIAAGKAAVALAAESLARAEADAEALGQAAAKQAASAVEARRARNAVAEAEATKAVREAEVAAAEARLDELRVRHDDLEIRAPFAGQVVRRHRDAGAWVTPGEAVVDLIANSLEVTVAVPERFWSGVSRHARSLQATIAGSRTRMATASLRIVGDLDAATRTFRVVGLLAEPDAGTSLAPGLSVQVDLPTGPAQPQLVVPAAAVIRGGAPYVYVVRDQEEGPAQAKRVVVQILHPCPGGLAVSADGLGAGDRVVVEGNERLHPGAAVRVVDGAAAAPDEASGGEAGDGNGDA